MQMKKVILIISLAFLNLFFIQCGEDPVEETTGTIEGVVYNFASSEVIGNAFVITNPPSSSVTTDSLKGSFKIEHVDPGLYRVIGNKVGFDSAGVNISVLAGEKTTADIALLADTTTTN
jgi:hypothetical protein